MTTVVELRLHDCLQWNAARERLLDVEDEVTSPSREFECFEKILGLVTSSSTWGGDSAPYSRDGTPIRQLHADFGLLRSLTHELHHLVQ